MDRLLAAIDAGATIVTVNRRLARTVVGAYARSRVARGERVWDGPDVLPYDAWLRRLWADASEVGRLPALAPLSDIQERALWEQTSGASTAVSGAARGTFAALAREAWASLATWELPLDRLLAEPAVEVQAFAAAARDYQRRCGDGGWTDAPSMARAVIRCVAPGWPELPRRLVLAGFDDMTPQQRSLAAALARAGVEVEAWHPAPRPGRRSRVELPDVATELACAARWLRARLAEEETAELALLVPDLAMRGPEIRWVLEETLTPGAAAGRAGRPGFNVSLGAPLAAAPAVRAALAALGLLTGRLPTAAARRVLLCAHYFGEPGEHVARAALEARLRALGEPEVSLATLAGLAASRAPALAGRLGHFDAWRRGLDRRACAGAWAAALWEGLALLGWPGEGPLASEDHQAVVALRDALAELGSLEPLLPPVAGAEALDRLQRLCARRPFQPEGEPAPVQVLGLLESAGQTFDGVWLLGLDDGRWPPPARPNPLLPRALQRGAGLPSASPEASRRFAERITRRLLASAPHVVASHALRAEDVVRRASVLVRALDAVGAEDLGLAPEVAYSAALLAARPALAEVVEAHAPPLAPGTPVAGGARVLQHQSHCPFLAFAVHRLGAEGSEDEVAPLAPRQRGTLVHRLLERLWRTLGSQAALIALDSTGREALLAAAAGEVVAAEARRWPALRGRLGELERRRLEDLARRWLELEAQRPPFEVVAPERDADVDIGGLRLTLRPDRVDRLADGRVLVVDYKTGDPRISGWLGARPEDPQVAVYACWLPEPAVAGAAYAVLGADRVELRGLGVDDTLAAGIRRPGASHVPAARALGEWDALVAELGRVHEALAAAFAAGTATVDPREPGKTCRGCDMRMLCRVDEGASQAGATVP